ncbi:cadherin domain-containing protein, partial [Aphelenchoides avenae]
MYERPLELQDPSDMLRYAIVDPYTPNSAVAAPFSPSALKFTVEPETGVIRAQPDILPGLHRFNVSVTDGRYIVHAPVTVDISNIDQDALDHSVSIRIRNMPARTFVRSHLQRFHELLAHAVGVPATNIRILSLQNVEEPQNVTSVSPEKKAIGVVNAGTPNGFIESNTLLRSKRTATSLVGTNGFLPLTAGNTGDLDVLFTVLRGENRGYHRPSYVKNQMERGVADLSAQSGLDVTSLTSEVCRRDVCLKGECRDRLWLDNVQLDSVEDPQSGQSFVSPRHVRTFECICRQGYAGRHCDVPVNKCSKELCSRFEMCIPSDTEPTGFLCTCPPGLKGPRCDEPTCEDSRACSQTAELSVLGNGYFELQLSNTVESRLELSVQFKTVSRSAVVMHGHGLQDFHTLQIIDGFVEYQWDCGSGPGTAQIAHVRVDDGNWHTAKIVRRGRHARLTLDDSHHAEATSAHGSDVVNLYRNAIV